MILITGGAGYIGSHVNKMLNIRGYGTIVFDNLCRGHQDFVRWGHFICGDLADVNHLRLCFKRYPIDVVMHFGAYAYVAESMQDPARYYWNNVVNTMNLLDIMREFHVKHFIFSSSCSTYGIPERLPITEDHPQHPINPYGKTKYIIEQILKDYELAYGILHINLRYFNAAGADLDAEIGERHEPETHLIPLALDIAIGKSEKLVIYGGDYNTPDGTCIRDYIHVNDVAEAHILAMNFLKTISRSDSFNLGNGNGFSNLEVVKTIEIVTGRSIGVLVADRRPGDPAILVANSDKAKEMLSWYPRITNLSEIINSAWRWHLTK